MVNNMLNAPFSPKDHIRAIPDFPKKGILFYDISTLLADAKAWRLTIDYMRELIAPLKPDFLVGIDARGFLLAAPLAYSMGLGSVMVRKKGKLPGNVIEHAYALEYGENIIAIQQDAFKSHDKQHPPRVVVLDDLLATGGTCLAAIELCQKAGADVVGAGFIIELNFLKARTKFHVPIISLAGYDE
jgi:adenine phosphoribosyltransferase